MNQLVPVSPKIKVVETGQYDITPRMFTLHAQEDGIIRGIIGSGSSFGTVEIYKGGTERSCDGEKVFEAEAGDFCYNFIPLEIPIEADGLLKAYFPTCSSFFSLTLLSDKIIDFLRLLDDYSVTKMDWAGADPTYQTGDPDVGAYGNFSSISPAAYFAFAHTDLIMKARVFLPFPAGTTPGTVVYLPYFRSDQSGNNAYRVKIGSWYDNPNYGIKFDIDKVVSGSPTTLSTLTLTSSYNDCSGGSWCDVEIYMTGGRIYAKWQVLKSSSLSNYRWVANDTAHQDGDYLFVPTGNNLKIARFELY